VFGLKNKDGKGGGLRPASLTIQNVIEAYQKELMMDSNDEIFRQESKGERKHRAEATMVYEVQ